MGLVIVIEPHGTYAIYEQIVNQIKNQIISGEPVSYTHLTLPTT